MADNYIQSMHWTGKLKFLKINCWLLEHEDYCHRYVALSVSATFIENGYYGAQKHLVKWTRKNFFNLNIKHVIVMLFFLKKSKIDFNQTFY